MFKQVILVMFLSLTVQVILNFCRPHVVNIKWLIESMAQKRPAFEEPFDCLPCENMNVSEAPSPLSKKVKQNFYLNRNSVLKHYSVH